MVKLAKLEGNRDIVQELADGIKKSAIRVSAEEVLSGESDAEKAVNVGKTYWMMGWNFAEIESVLTDLEYTENTISKVMNAVKEYAKSIVTEGPFSHSKAGQTVKLKNGNLAVLINMSSKVATVEDTDTGEYMVSTDQIDLESSKKLAAAFNMRESAKTLLRTVVGDKYSLPPLPQTEEKKPETVVEYGFSELPFSPSGLSDVTPDKGDALPLNKKLEQPLATLEGLGKAYDEIDEKITKFREAYLNPLNDERQSLDKKSQDAVRNIYLVLGEIGEGLKGVNDVLFRDYKGQLVALRNEVNKNNVPPAEADELVALKEILNVNHPDIAGKVLAALDKWKEAAKTVETNVKKKLYLFPYRKIPKDEREEHPFGKNTKSSLDNGGELKDLWKEIRSFNDEFANTLGDIVGTTKSLKSITNSLITSKSNARVSAAIDACTRNRKF